MECSNLEIRDIEIRACCSEARLTEGSLRSDSSGALNFLFLTATTSEGLQASCFGFAGKNALAAGEMISTSLKPFFIGRSALDREKAWHQFRTADRWWHHLPFWAYGPFDSLCWILSALAANQPLYRYLGGYRDTVPVYLSSLVHDSPQQFAEEALATQNQVFFGYKLHPKGEDLRQDREADALVREATGPDFILMSDPVASMNLEEAIRFGRFLEKLDYHWLEEPLWDEDFHSLRELTRVLEIPVVGCEVLNKHPYSVAECISRRVVDRVRADISWTRGVTGTMKTAGLTEAFGVNCEVHTSIFHGLDLVNLHCIGAMKN